MRFPRVILFLVVANLSADVVSFSAGEYRDLGQPGIVLVLSALFSQANLLAIWMVMGGGRLWIRVIVAIIGYALLYVVTRPGAHNDNDALVLVFAVQFVVVSLGMSTIRLSGLGIHSIHESSFSGAETAIRPLQFSIRNLLQLTVVSAALSAVIIRLVIDRGTVW